MIAPPMPSALLQRLNQEYLAVHTAKEDAFWEEKMGLRSARPGAFESHEIAYQAFVTDPSPLAELRAVEPADLQGSEAEAWRGWIRFFEAHTMENPEARHLHAALVEREGRLAEARRRYASGYQDPLTGAFTPASSVKLGLLVKTAPDEALRRAAHEGLARLGTAMLEAGFLDIVRERNRLARLLGYGDYYDFKVSRNEGFSKARLFEVLDDLEQRTRESGRAAVARAERRHGSQARRGWNLGYLTSGDVTQKLDPYFPFETALERWGRSFSALGIRYRGATLTLDLLDRRGKYENGFMHGPGPAWLDGDTFRPARINFTANAIPGQVGSGQRALETLFHEGGHAAHFSNIRMPSPCFSQEYAPTSVAFAETQSMFLDSFVETPAWQARYVRDAQGRPLPWDIARESLACKHPLRAWQLRAMLTVCYAEKALYELPDHSLEPARVCEALAEVERRLQFLEEGARPVLSVPHLLAWESSAYYHGYVLAEMAVHQTRRYFLRRDGALADNPAIGPDLDRHYWAPGNSRTFFDLVEGLTGEPFSAEATAEAIGRPLEEALEDAEAEFRKTGSRTADGSAGTAPVDLEATLRLVHGDTLIGECRPGDSFAVWTDKFRAFLARLEKA